MFKNNNDATIDTNFAQYTEWTKTLAPEHSEPSRLSNTKQFEEDVPRGSDSLQSTNIHTQ